MTLRDDLIAAKALIDTPEKCACGGKKTGMSLNQALDNTAGTDDHRYDLMVAAIISARAPIPRVRENWIELSHRASHEAVMLWFDRAIAAAESAS